MTMTQNPHPKFRVAIAGGGIAGAALATALSQQPNITFELYEQGRTFETTGAGVGLWKKTHNILKSWGLEESIQSIIPPESKRTSRPAFSIRKSDQADPVQVSLLKIAGSFQVHRTGFLDVLSSKIPHSHVHFRTRVESYEEPANPLQPIILHLSDGTTAECDVLLACDGVKSTVRKQMFAPNPEEHKYQNPVWTGTLAYRGLYPTTLLPEGHSALAASVLVYTGKNAYVCCYRVKADELMNVVAFVTDPSKEATHYPHKTLVETTNANMLAHFTEWEDDVKSLLKHIETPSVWSVQTANLLPTFARGRVALFGDAAHAMAPHLAQGANSALEDVFIVSTLLSHPSCTRETLTEALAAYSDFRRPRGNDLIVKSRDSGMLYDHRGPRFSPDLKDRVVNPDGTLNLDLYADAVNRRWMRAESGDLEPDIEGCTSSFLGKIGA